VNLHDRDRLAWMSAPEPATSHAGGLIAESAFLSGEPLPLKREMAVLFVDMVDSTRLLFSHTPEDVLRVVQTFMQVVVDVAVQHCGDVHDFEGDGAMLYFAGSGEAVPAAFDLRKALAAKRHCEPELPQARFALDAVPAAAPARSGASRPRLFASRKPQARFALDAGPLVVGRIGSHERRALAFIGPSVNTAARILKLASPGGIVATEAVIAHARRSDPDLAAEFHALPQKQTLKGFDQAVTVYQAAPSQGDAGHICS
jgi:class 3 adenylate cyclase